jgi:uncharacterized protein YkwD
VALAAATCLSVLALLAACSEPSEPPASRVPAASTAAAPSAASTASIATAPGSEPVYRTETAAAPTPAPPTPEPGPPEVVEPPQEPAAAPEPSSAPVVALAAPTQVVEPPAPAVVASGNASFVDRVLQLINAARQQEGLVSLSPAAALMEAAQQQAQDMAEAGRLSHTGPNGSTVEGRVQAAGYGSWTELGEVCAAGDASPEAVVADWLASPEHRARLLDPAFTEVGAGYYYLSGSSFEHWWVVDLAAH